MKNAIEDIVNCAALILLLAAVRCVAVLDAHAMTVCRSDTVNCFVGTGGTGHCFPAAAYPFGLVQAGPDTGWGTWDYCSGYRYEDGQITMFSQTHNPGGGCPDYADVGIMPFVGDAANVVSTFSHENETATPGYYAVSLDRGGIRVEIAASEHSAIYRIRPEHPREMRLLVDLDYGMGNRTWAKKTVEPLDVRRSEDGEIRAHLLRNGFVKNRHIGVYIRCNPAPVSVEELSAELGVHAPKYVLSFNLPPDGQLFVKLGLSTTDSNGAARNLDCEIPAWDFDAVRLAARAKWDEVLSRGVVRPEAGRQGRARHRALVHRGGVRVGGSGFLRQVGGVPRSRRERHRAAGRGGSPAEAHRAPGLRQVRSAAWKMRGDLIWVIRGRRVRAFASASNSWRTMARARMRRCHIRGIR